MKRLPTTFSPRFLGATPLKSFTIAALLSIGLLSTTSAEVYRTVDAHGNVTYTDSKPLSKKHKVEEVKLRKTNTASSVKMPAKEVKEDKKPKKGYDTVRIVTPSHDSTIPPGQLDVVVQVFLKPSLKVGHKLKLMLNGKPYKTAAATSFNLNKLHRGSTILQAIVVNANGKQVARSKPVTMHVKRHSAKFNN